LYAAVGDGSSVILNSSNVADPGSDGIGVYRHQGPDPVIRANAGK
jgi:hypothetical protein